MYEGLFCLAPRPCTIVIFLLEECLEYGLVVPFPAYGFASLVSHNESLNSLNRSHSVYRLAFL